MRFINFDHAAKFVDVIRRATGFPQTLKHEPRGVLADADLLRKLQAGNPLARRDQEIHCVDPLMKRNMRPAEDRSSPHSEVQLAGVAPIETTFARRYTLRGLAARAARAIRPQPILKVLAGAGFIREHLEKLEGANG